METKYVYRDAVLPKAALQGKTFNLIAALCVRYPQGKQVRLDFEVCSPSSAFAAGYKSMKLFTPKTAMTTECV
ncbi:hypothetical protein CAMRE0001_2326 [Campylobacter rectus RM3267]|uniref:Uncharacterized protein n=1 Tax=Campylobacter rectus RM3267 TaxID=553218 RepID=B9D5G8_CAMRE|nr:hypothetical protein [Campylobacter rectus]EEF12774.1 hypothetical protein CAMRE0001_2326 [Campylobacter rectus RM3267]UEB48503.1 hypothetical protein LK437_04085 [Campylobacter rectus]